MPHCKACFVAVQMSKCSIIAHAIVALQHLQLIISDSLGHAACSLACVSENSDWHKLPSSRKNIQRLWEYRQQWSGGQGMPTAAAADTC